MTKANASVAAATLASATLAGNFSRIAAFTDSSEICWVAAAKPPSNAAFGSGRPTCLSANSVAGTVWSRSGLKPAAIQLEKTGTKR